MAELLRDELLDEDGVLLQNHVGGLTWTKQGSRDLQFSGNTLIKSLTGGSVFYRAEEDPGIRLVRVSMLVHPLESGFQSVGGGVSACHDAVDGLAGYYAVIRSDTPEGGFQGPVRLFGWDENGDDLFPEVDVDYDVGLEDTDIELTLEITPTEVRVYLNDELKITQADAALIGTLVGLLGGWSTFGGEGMHLQGPFIVTDLDVEEEEEECFPDTSSVQSDPAVPSYDCISEGATAVCFEVDATVGIELDDSCIPVGTLVGLIQDWFVGDGQIVGSPTLSVG